MKQKTKDATPSPSIPVKEGDESNLQKLADLLESRGVRKFLNINNFGYSQIERDIVELFEPPALPVKEGEVLDITPGPWKAEWTHRIDGGSKLGWYISDENETELYVPINPGKNAEGNAKAICTAVNNTYGKGFDPSKMEELYKAGVRAMTELAALYNFDLRNAPDYIKEFQSALQNAKTIRP